MSTTSSAPSTLTYGARDVLASRAGVCRDYAHLMIALCRALNIPARFVTAYTRYDVRRPISTRWRRSISATGGICSSTALAPTEELIRIGTGRDALDVPFATFFGSARMQRMSPLVAPATGNETLVALQTPGAGIMLGAMVRRRRN